MSQALLSWLHGLERGYLHVNCIPLTDQPTMAYPLWKRSKPNKFNSGLTIPRLQGTYKADTDACDKQNSTCIFTKASLSNRQSNTILVRSLNTDERPYNVMNRKCLAVVCSVLLLRSYLKGFQLIFWTDDDAYKCIPNLLECTGSIVLWRLRLSDFEFHVVHWICMKHHAADSSPRIKTIRTAQTPTRLLRI